MNSSMCPYIQTYLQFSTLIKKTAVWKNGRKLLQKASASQHVELWKTVPKDIFTKHLLHLKIYKHYGLSIKDYSGQLIGEFAERLCLLDI